MSRISIYRPCGSLESTWDQQSRDEARAEVAKLRAKIKAAGEDAKGWTVRLRHFS